MLGGVAVYRFNSADGLGVIFGQMLAELTGEQLEQRETKIGLP